MTAPARISQADIERAMKAVAASGIPRARIIMDLEARKIEIITGETVEVTPTTDKWSDDDV